MAHDTASHEHGPDCDHEHGPDLRLIVSLLALMAALVTFGVLRWGRSRRSRPAAVLGELAAHEPVAAARRALRGVRRRR